MKRIFGAAAVLVFILGLLPVQTTHAVDTSNFRITSFDIQYELSRDSESRSVLKTTETITAVFPASDQNHGLERAIPTSYDGHPTHVEILDVTNGHDTLEYSTDTQNGALVLRIGNADTYVHGEQLYQITYTQRDVTRYYADTGRDEWYWDTNGTEWAVPIDVLRISVLIDPSIAAARVGEPACYQSAFGLSDACVLVANGDAGYTVEAASLQPGQNVTVAFGFTQGTFAPYARSFADTLALIWGIIQIATIPIAVLLIVIFGVIATRRTYRKSEENPIPAEYIPPRTASVIVSAQVLSTAVSPFSAQLIDLAVRHFIEIIETKPKSTWRPAEYDIVIITDPSKLFEEEQEILRDMFGHLPTVGERLALSTLKNNMSYATRTLDNDKKLKELIEKTYKLREKSPRASRLFYAWAIGVLILAIFTLSIALGVAALVLWLYGLLLRPLTDDGLRLRRYVLGLDRYIKAAEVERLKFFQGPDTAQKVGYDLDPTNPGQLLKLYERVLPYAILFGREKDWAQRLGDFYQQAGTSPDWYTGSTAFNAALFSSTLSSFSQASTYSAGSSSSSGGSSGGGSSGGGGGGGGGGGW